jgi:tape measure domain-containing protein
MASLLSSIASGATIAITIKAIDEFSKTISEATRSFNSLGGIMTSIGKIGASAMIAVGTAMVSVGVASVKLAGDFEQTKVAFTTMLGSAEKATSFLNELANFAKRTPFTIQGVEKSAKQLMAVGFEAEDVIPTLKSVGDIASGLGLGEEGLERLILNLGQVQTQGKITGRELRDFAVAGVPLLKELSNQLGVSEQDITDMISKGEISTQMVLDAFKNMTSEGGRFGDLMAKQALTFNGMISNMKDTITLMGREIGMALLPPLKELLDIFANDILPSIQPLIPLFIEFTTTIVEGLIPYLPKLSEMITKLFEVFMKLFTALQPLMGPLMDLAFVIFDALFVAIEPLIPTIQILAESLVPLFNALSPIITALSPIIKMASELIAIFIKLGINSIMASLKPALEIIIPILTILINVFTKIIEVVKSVVDWITQLINKVREFFTTGFEKIGGAVEGITSKTSSKSSVKPASNLSVMDAVISPTGNIISTSPSDYLIATQNPSELGRGTTIIIEGNIYGVDADDMADALVSKLKEKISIY